MQGGTSNGQVLAMRYVIIDSMSQDTTSCTYKAEDVYDDTDVIIKAIDLSITLTERQIEDFKSISEAMASLPKEISGGLKSFQACGKLRFFVYEYHKANLPQINKTLENIKEYASKKIAQISSEKASEILSLSEALQQTEKRLKDLNDKKDKAGKLCGLQKKELKKLDTLIQDMQKSQTQDMEDIRQQLEVETQAKLNAQQDSLILNQKIEELNSVAVEDHNLFVENIDVFEKKVLNLQGANEQGKASIELKSLKIEQLEEEFENQRKELFKLLNLSEEKNKSFQIKKKEASGIFSQQQLKIESLKADLNNQTEEYTTLLDQMHQKLETQISSRELTEKRCSDIQNETNTQISKAANLKADLTSQIRELERRLNDQSKISESTEADLAGLIEKVKNQKNQFSSESQKHSAEIEQANWKNQKLSEGLKETDQAIETLKEDKFQLEQKNRDILQSHQQMCSAVPIEKTDQSKELKNAYWKIQALTAEMQKLIDAAEKSKPVAQQGNSPRKSKLLKTALPLTLLSGIACGIIGTSIYNNHIQNDKIAVQQSNKTSTSIGIDNITEAKAPVVQQVVGDVDLEEIANLSKKIETKALTKSPLENEILDDERQFLEDARMDAMHKIALSYLNGIGAEKNIAKATHWFEKAIEAGSGNAMIDLGMLYYHGGDYKQDLEKAFDLFKRSANANNPMAMHNVGTMYLEGKGIAKDDLKAIEWYEKAAEKGLPKALNQLAQMYYYGQTVEQDHAKAAGYYKRSAIAGDIKAMYNLAMFYYNGEGIDKDYIKAMNWFIKAARLGDSESMFKLGILFEGEGSIKEDLDKSAYWFNAAAKAGHDGAVTKLKELATDN